MKPCLVVLFACMLLAVFCEKVGASEADFVEDEDGLMKSDSGRHQQWQRCRGSHNCKPGYYCRRQWCYPRYPCSINAHCPAKHYCDVNERVCKPGEMSCSSHRACGDYKYCKNGRCVNKECHRYQPCRYGYQCTSPGLCKLRNGFCKDASQCQPGQCCLKAYGQNYAGTCKQHQRPNDWCDTKVKETCPCVDGYTCERRWWQWGRCTSKPTTPAPTDEPGSGDIDSL